jgi:hypothetical protein
MRRRLLVLIPFTAAALAAGIVPADAVSPATVTWHTDSQATTQAPAGWDGPSGIAGADGHLHVAAQNPEISATPGSPDVSMADSGNCDGSSTGNRSLVENNTVYTDQNGYLVADWGDQRLDPNGLGDAAQSNAQTLQEAYDEIFATCQTGGPSLLANPRGKPTCGTKLKWPAKARPGHFGTSCKGAQP